MPLIRAQVVIPYDSNLPEDVITNTLYFVRAGDWPPVDLAALNEAIGIFYGAVYGTRNVPTYVNPAGATIRFYDMAQAEPRVPIVQALDWPVVPSQTSSNVPRQASCVLSFHGTPEPGIPQARRRGRIYLGALTNAWIETTDPGPHFGAAVRSAICAAAASLQNDADTAGYQWMVYSETSNATAPVVGGWVDNAIDTQRRRVQAATLRTTFS